MKIKKSELLDLIRQAIEEVEEEMSNGEETSEANISHAEDGTFTSPEKSTCDSFYFSGGKRKRKSGGLTDPDDTGRGSRFKGGKGRYRCRDNKPLWGNLEELIRDAVIEVLEERKDPKQVAYDRRQKMIKGCRRMGLRSFGETLAIINSIQKAEKGELYDKK